MDETTSGVFISHSHQDKEFVERLAHDLQFYGIRVWIDDAELGVGDSLIQKVADAIEACEYLVVVLSPHSVGSAWVEKELQIAMTQEIKGRRVVVLPLLRADCHLPAFLVDKVYADFRTEERYGEGLNKILKRLGVTALVPRSGERVCVIYAGGSAGLVRPHRARPGSPLRHGTWRDFEEVVPALRELAFHVDFVSLAPPLDSAEIGHEAWKRIAEAIYLAYGEHSGFVVLVSTDTIVYTATALSFMLENLGKPVVVTGADVPLGFPNTDAARNLVDSLLVAAPRSAGINAIPEVLICFAGLLIRGNRARRQSLNGVSQFASPSYPLLGETGRGVRINASAIAPPPASGASFYATDSLDTRVVSLNVFPGMDPAVVDGLFTHPTSGPAPRALVLVTPGASQAKLPRATLAVLERLSAGGVLVVAMPHYPDPVTDPGFDAAAALMDSGVVPALDMTLEAAIVKAMYLLGRGYPIGSARELMQVNLRGEQSGDLYTFALGPADATLAWRGVFIPSGSVDVRRIQSASLCFSGVQHTGSQRLTLEIALNGKPAGTSRSKSHDSASVERTTIDPSGGSFRLDVTDLMRARVTPGRPNVLAISAEGRAELCWAELRLVLYCAA